VKRKPKRKPLAVKKVRKRKKVRYRGGGARKEKGKGV
jgi:hypothetical protein